MQHQLTWFGEATKCHEDLNLHSFLNLHLTFVCFLNNSSCAFMAPGILAGTAFLFSMFAGIYCKFISHVSTDAPSGETVTLNSGIWYYQGYSIVNTTFQGTVILETCINYPEGTYFDSEWKSAKAFSAMALIIGGIVAFWGLFAQCIYPNKGMYQRGGMLLLLCCLVSCNAE